MRIGIGSVSHETNTFSSVPTTEAVFKSQEWLEGEEVILMNDGKKNYLGGIIDVAKARNDIELVPSLSAVAGASGLITRDAFELIRDTLIRNLLRSHMQEPLDGIALMLHGAGVADGYFDIEGEILSKLREEFGSKIPVGVVLDLHGNISDQMVNLSDIIIGVKNYPHDDMHERAGIMLNMLCDIISAGEKPFKCIIHLPWLLSPIMCNTFEGPARDIRVFCEKMERENTDLLHCTFFHGFPYSDIPQAGASVVTIAKTQTAADRIAQRIAQYAWARRGELMPKRILPAEAIDRAISLSGRPIVINESSDNPGGGAPGDGTYLLRELLNRNLPYTAIACINDKEVVDIAHKAGVGSIISCKLGGKIDYKHGSPVNLKDAYVKCLTDGQFIRTSPMEQGVMTKMGRCARLTVGNVDIIVSSTAQQVFDNGVFLLHGIDVTKLHIIGLKSTWHFYAWYKNVAAHILSTDPPGIHCGCLDNFDYKNVDRNYYPFNRKSELPT